MASAPGHARSRRWRSVGATGRGSSSTPRRTRASSSSSSRPAPVDGVRAAPIAGVLLTDAEIDHTAGLLLLRESATPVRIFGDEGVETRAADTGIRCCRCSSATAGSSGTRWSRSEPTPLDGSSLVVEPFHVGGDAPRYLGGSDVELEASGFMFRDRAGGGVRHLRPRPRPARRRRARAASPRATSCSSTAPSGATTSSPGSGISERSARDMGHVPLSGPAGRSRRWRDWRDRVRCSSTSTTRTRSCSRTRPSATPSLRAGVEVAYDGLEIEL